MPVRKSLKSASPTKRAPARQPELPIASPASTSARPSRRVASSTTNAEAERKLQEVLNRLPHEKVRCVDVETSGLDWRNNHIVGYVLTFGPRPQDTYYVPFRHLGNANVGGRNGPTTPFNWDGKLAPGEKDLVLALDKQGTTLFGHHMNFDLKFLFRTGKFDFNPRCEDTQINAPLINEWQGKFSLEFCADVAKVQAKKSNVMVDYLCKTFPEAAKDPKRAMGHYWRLPGNDPVAVEYAEGDGTTTWQLRDYQMQEIHNQELDLVWDIESRLIPVLARMSCRGIRIDEEEFKQVRIELKQRITELENGFPSNFNVRGQDDVRHWMEKHGHTDWPMTPPSKRFPRGQPSLNKAWLENYEAGQKIVNLRKLYTLRDAFVLPLQTTHLYNGYVHTNYNQLRNDEFGTITGRLSSDGPNMQAAPKHDEDIGRLFRRAFAAETGMKWGSVDYSQCLVAGTKVMVPGGTKNIEDMQVGDWVYSYDNARRLVLRKVTWAGQTGVRSVCRVKWATNGRTSGHLDVTPDHKIRLINGTYKTVAELASSTTHSLKKKKHPYFIKVLALRRGFLNDHGSLQNALWTTGTHRFKESRFVFEQTNGWSPEHVHHRDENTLNDDPSNLEGLTQTEQAQRKERSLIATRALQQKFKLINNHYITHIIPLNGVQPVYDITVEDTHNFIANEICVHNCEPRLLAYYARCKVLIEGYLRDPPIDAHTAVAEAANKNWFNLSESEQKYYRNQFAKRINQTIITGGGKNVLVNKYKVPRNEIDKVWSDYHRAMPEIAIIQKRMERKMLERGYILTLLKRRCRLFDRDKSYVALNRALQGGNADILKLKMVEVDEYLASEGRPLDMINNCHDATDFQFPEEARPVYNECLRIMQDFHSDNAVIKLPTGDGRFLPIPLDEGEGPNWAVATYGPEENE